MTEEQPEIQSKNSINYSRSVLIILLLVCLCIAGFIFVESFSDFDLASLLNNPLIIPALLLQVFASILFVLAWKVLLSVQTQHGFTSAQCAAQIGITLLGKYLPGKIWGLVGRTYLLNSKGVSKSESLSLLLADQFITFFTGIAIGTVALCTIFYGKIAIPLAILALLTVPIVGKYYSEIISWLTQYLGRWLKKVSSATELQEVKIPQKVFIGSSLIYLLHWLATASVLILLFYPLISDRLILNGSLLIAAIPLAMLSGFLAFWAPGGIGVREGVIVGILAINLPFDTALTVALSYRLICILIDLCFGTFTLLYYSRTEPGLLGKT
jgi:glycosyltransferase 2 family protein